MDKFPLSIKQQGSDVGLYKDIPQADILFEVYVKYYSWQDSVYYTDLGGESIMNRSIYWSTLKELIFRGLFEISRNIL